MVDRLMPVGSQGSRWQAELPVEVDGRGEGEDARGDAADQSVRGSRPVATGRKQRQRFWLVLGASGSRRFATGCQRLQPRGSIKAPSLVVREGDSGPA